MCSVQELMRFLPTDTCKDSKKHRKKKSKKLKRDKLDKDKLEKKNKQWLKHYTQCCEAQLPAIKKRKKKKTEVGLTEEFSLPQTQCKLSKPYKKHKSSSCTTDSRRVAGHIHPGPAELDKQKINKNKNKKRVTFTLSPVLIQPTRDLQPQSSTAKLPSPNPGFFTNRLKKECAEENISQTPSEDINSQDLFITQKSKNFSDPYIDICSSASVDEIDAFPVQRSHRPLTSDKSVVEASTQTENFFTSPMPATSIRINSLIVCTEPPLDLSVPKRSDAFHPQFPNTSSDDSDTTLKTKSGVSQIKVVQTRLNESFFFKLKGDVDSPKPRSPLMQFANSTEKRKS